jgi:hypothetical protein
VFFLWLDERSSRLVLLRCFLSSLSFSIILFALPSSFLFVFLLCFSGSAGLLDHLGAWSRFRFRFRFHLLCFFFPSTPSSSSPLPTPSSY